MNDDIPLHSLHPTSPGTRQRYSEVRPKDGMPDPDLSVRRNSRTRPAVHYISRSSSSVSSRSLLGFWILGLCNNFAYVVMLSAAKDILETDSGAEKHNLTQTCREPIVDRQCQRMSTGAVLLADIIPALVVKVTAPLYIRMVPFGLRHLLVVMAQMLSFILVAASNNVSFALFGVVVASWGSGLGEISYLALASYFDSYVRMFFRTFFLFVPSHKITSLSGVLASGLYWNYLQRCTEFKSAIQAPTSCEKEMIDVAQLGGDPRRQNPKLKGRFSMVTRRVKPVVFFQALTLIKKVEEVFKAFMSPEPSSRGGLYQELRYITPLFKYMIPLIIVYFAEYFINQGLVIWNCLEFDCSHGFSLSPQSQYRWYQVLYQVGVFISRSSSDLIALPGEVLPVLAMLQVLNATVLYCEAMNRFVSHIFILFCVIVYEGLLGGASYVNTFRVIHEEIPADRKEFSMGFVSISTLLVFCWPGSLRFQSTISYAIALCDIS
ncbi:CLN3 protein [Cooperia oncophora]